MFPGKSRLKVFNLKRLYRLGNSRAIGAPLGCCLFVEREIIKNIALIGVTLSEWIAPDGAKGYASFGYYKKAAP